MSASRHSEQPECDIFIIGGGINGCGIARDAAGRGLKVGLAEMQDLGGATSSASTKLFHGGLRYLEYFELRLVREALIEREVLLRAMPHISWPMRFVLPYHSDMRFESDTPTSKLLGGLMPWMRGRRPAWLIRLGLFLYDHLGGRKILPATRTLSLAGSVEGVPLQARFAKAFEYSDCWVEDSRLVALNARDAAERGAQIMTRHRVISAERGQEAWQLTMEQAQTGQRRSVSARMVVNAAGPWVGDVLGQTLRINSPESVRLVRGSHIVVPRLYEHDKCYFFQGEDGRIIFAIPYEGRFTLIGTTDADHAAPDQPATCTPEEQDYLCAFASQYFAKPVTREQIVWTYSGLRPLYDDGAETASAATRDYTLTLSDEAAPLLNIFGGKITTYRRLAESALDKIATQFPDLPGPWTAGVPLPGGDFPVDGVADQIQSVQRDYPFVGQDWATRLVRAYGSEAWQILQGAKCAEDLGKDFGATLTEAEVRWLQTHEFAQSADDILWRRSKLGLHMSPAERAQLIGFLANENA